PPVDDGNKLVTCRVRLVRRLDRWDETTARLFAADCAEAALLGERASGREPDERTWAAVDAARRYARGEIDRGEFNAARAAEAADAAVRAAAVRYTAEAAAEAAAAARAAAVRYTAEAATRAAAAAAEAAAEAAAAWGTAWDAAQVA